MDWLSFLLGELVSSGQGLIALLEGRPISAFVSLGPIPGGFP